MGTANRLGSGWVISGWEWVGGQSDGGWKVARDQGLYVVQKGNGYFDSDSEERGSV